MRVKVSELINSGDWACSEGDGEALARVCLQLCDEVDDAVAAAAVRIARLTRGDLTTASLEWAELVVRIKGEAFTSFDPDLMDVPDARSV